MEKSLKIIDKFICHLELEKSHTKNKNKINKLIIEINILHELKEKINSKIGV